MRYQVTVSEQNKDIRWDGFEARRNMIAGLGWTFVSLVDADTEEEAETLLRENERFRRSARQNGVDWETVFILVEKENV